MVSVGVAVFVHNDITRQDTAKILRVIAVIGRVHPGQSAAQCADTCILRDDVLRHACMVQAVGHKGAVPVGIHHGLILIILVGIHGVAVAVFVHVGLALGIAELALGYQHHVLSPVRIRAGRGLGVVLGIDLRIGVDEALCRVGMLFLAADQHLAIALGGVVVDGIARVDLVVRFGFGGFFFGFRVGCCLRFPGKIALLRAVFIHVVQSGAVIRFLRLALFLAADQNLFEGIAVVGVLMLGAEQFAGLLVVAIILMDVVALDAAGQHFLLLVAIRGVVVQHHFRLRLFLRDGLTFRLAPGFVPVRSAGITVPASSAESIVSSTISPSS